MICKCNIVTFTITLLLLFLFLNVVVDCVDQQVDMFIYSDLFMDSKKKCSSSDVRCVAEKGAAKTCEAQGKSDGKAYQAVVTQKTSKDGNAKYTTKCKQTHGGQFFPSH